MKRFRNPLEVVAVFALLLALSSPVFGQSNESSRQNEGLQENRPSNFILTHATVVVRPGQTIEDATLVIRDGRFTSVRGEAAEPGDYRTIDMTGKMIYAGLIDSWRGESIVISEEPEHPRYWNVNIRPERTMTTSFAWDGGTVEGLREAGITAALVSPQEGIFKGQASLMLTVEADQERMVPGPDVCQTIELTTPPRFGGPRVYPSSPMGGVALARQAILDAQWYGQAWEVANQQSGINLPEFNASLAALQSVVSGDQPVVAVASNELMSLRADRFAREFGLDLIILGSGNEYRRLDDISALGRRVIVPVNFTAPPDVRTPEAVSTVSLEELMHWDISPENPARLHQAGVAFAFTSNGLRRPDEFLSKIRQAVTRGLDKDAALAALTTTPAEWYGVSKHLGSIETGKLANLIVTDGDLFDDKTRILETWVAGERFDFEREPEREPAGTWQMTARDTEGTAVQEFTMTVSKDDKSGDLSATIDLGENTETEVPGDDNASESSTAESADDPSEEDANQDERDEEENSSESDESEEVDAIKIDNFTLEVSRISGMYAVPGGDDDSKQFAQFSMVIEPGNDTGTGTLLLPDGTRLFLSGTRTSETSSESDDDDAKDENASDISGDGQEEAADDDDDAAGSDGSDESQRGGRRGRRGGRGRSGGDKYNRGPASFAVNYPLGRYGVTDVPSQQDVLFQNMTVWTCGPQGVLPGASVLVRDGKIAGVYTADATLPECDLVVNGEGLHLTPGIIDCHSHMATDSGVNEGSQAVTAEVRIGDFIDCDDITIYRQLAGGVTTSNILHGSANPIGGQNQVIKLRWGMNDEAMKFAEAPAGIKFALGENVKRSNRSGSGPTRYPATRMGVEQLMHDRFQAALQYQRDHEEWQRTRQGLPPRRDLELDAILEIIEGKRWIHCHSYRQDEILALLRTLESYNIRIGTLQHILEGYKVAEKMAEHGAMASAFADWWAYKFEVYDAIPYAGAIMHNNGIVVSFNSDDAELATHLNQEAAKAVKYGGVAPEEALKFVTLNPARQLRIDQYVGSIEEGKHADLVVWNGSPLSVYSRAMQTWIDGRRYYAAPETGLVDDPADSMFAELVQKVLRSGESPRDDDSRDDDPQNAHLRFDEYCRAHGGNSAAARDMLQLQQAWENEAEEEE